MNGKFDYSKLEREYVQGDMSLRELAKSAGMNNHSLIMTQARKGLWTEKREAYRKRSETKALALMADDNGKRIAREAKVRDNAIDAIDEMVSRLRDDLKKTVKILQADGTFVDAPMVQIKPRDIALLIDKLQIIFGRPSTITEERSLGLNLTTADPDLLRQIVEATRGLQPDAGGSGRSPLPRTDEYRSN